MKKLIQNKLKNQKGLTLIELLAVIVILAIIAAIAIPAISNIIENSRHGAVKTDFQNVLAAADLYFAEEGGTTFELTADSDDDVEIALVAQYIEDLGSIDSFVVTKVATTGNTISGSATSNDRVYTILATDLVTKSVLTGMSGSEFGAAYPETEED